MACVLLQHKLYEEKLELVEFEAKKIKLLLLKYVEMNDFY